MKTKRPTKAQIENRRFLKRVYRVTVKQKSRYFGHHKDDIWLYLDIISTNLDNIHL